MLCRVVRETVGVIMSWDHAIRVKTGIVGRGFYYGPGCRFPSFSNPGSNPPTSSKQVRAGF